MDDISFGHLPVDRKQFFECDDALDQAFDHYCRAYGFSAFLVDEQAPDDIYNGFVERVRACFHQPVQPAADHPDSAGKRVIDGHDYAIDASGEWQHARDCTWLETK